MHSTIETLTIFNYYQFLKTGSVTYIKEPTETPTQEEIEFAKQSIIDSDPEMVNVTYSQWLLFLSAFNEFLKDITKENVVNKALNDYVSMLNDNYKGFRWDGKNFSSASDILNYVRTKNIGKPNFLINYMSECTKALTISNFKPISEWNLFKESAAIKTAIKTDFDIQKILVLEYRAFRNQALQTNKQGGGE